MQTYVKCKQFVDEPEGSMKYNDMTEGMATLEVNFVCIFFLIMYMATLTFTFD